MKKVKKRKKLRPSKDHPRNMLNVNVKGKGELWTRVIPKETKKNLTLAWQIQRAEENY